MRHHTHLKIKSRNRQQGFALTAELLLVIAIVVLMLNYLSGLLQDYLHAQDVDRAASQYSRIVVAVQKRTAHDGTLFGLWDTNGSKSATNATLSWGAADLPNFLDEYLVGHLNANCGKGADGWNPMNSAGGINDGDPSSMEQTALFPCFLLRKTDLLPFKLQVSSALSPDTNSSVASYVLYLDTQNANFDRRDKPENNILNLIMLRTSLEKNLTETSMGVASVYFVQPGALNDLADDINLTDTECETALIANTECDIAVRIDFAGSSNGLYKRVNNLNFFTDDVTIGSSIATGRQKCAYWTPNGTGWDGEMTDCGIKGGANDDHVVFVADRTTTSSLQITNEASLGHLCAQFEPTNEAGGVMSVRPHTTTPSTPCGITPDNTIIQLISDRAHVGRLLSRQVLSDEIYAGQTELFSSTNGQVMLKVFNSSHDAIVFSIDNLGNTSIAGDLEVDGNTTLKKNLTVGENATFNMSNNGRIQMGATTDASSLSFSRGNAGNFTIAASGVQLDIINDNNHGIRLESNGAGSKMTLDASEGVVAANGTQLHASKSALNGTEFDPTDGINTDAEKSLSALITADMAKYLDDFSSSVQVVGMDRVEGEFLQLQKPNCLHFMNDANYSSPEANPYRKFMADSGITSANGKEYARLLLVPTYFKTYNSAFGDNQLFAQHAIHSSADTWDVYLYLSGEGAFSTGAREDGAGGSIAVMLCDYSGLDVSKLAF